MGPWLFSILTFFLLANWLVIEVGIKSAQALGIR